MKKQYLDELRELLLRFEMSDEEMNDILNDYDQMYEDGQKKGLSDDEIYALLGTPDKVMNELKESYSFKYVQHVHHHHKNKLIAIMPFICVISYFILGTAFQLWHPGWLIFLFIPITAILTNHKSTNIATLTALSPFIATLTFFLIGYYTGIYHPTWLIFLLIPFLGALNDAKPIRSFGFAFVILLSVALYLFINYYYHQPNLGLVVFLLPIVYGVINGNIHIGLRFDTHSVAVTMTVFFTLIVYFVCGFLFGSWAYLWMVFLLIPMAAIIFSNKKKFELVALMPFISIILFYSLGFFFDLWAYSWIAFLLIPMVAILKNA